MKVYTYHDKTKEYISEIESNILDPEESKIQGKPVYSVPGNATTIKPPNTSDGKIAVFENGAWKIKDDLRGKIYYNKTTKEKLIVEEIGIKPGNGYTTKAPGSTTDEWDGSKWIKPLAAAKQEKIDEMKSKRIIAEEIYNSIVKVIKGESTFAEMETDKITEINSASSLTNINKISWG